jgi:hypothetical protein
VLRMASMGLSYQSYLTIHGAIGENAISIGVLLAAASIALYASGSLSSPDVDTGSRLPAGKEY